MAEGRIIKPDKDFTKETDKQIPEAQELAKVRQPLLKSSGLLTTFPVEELEFSDRKALAAGKAN